MPWWAVLPREVSREIRKRAGRAPFRELGYWPMSLGSVRLTSSGALPYKGIIHVACIAMIFRANLPAIDAALRNACRLAVDSGFKDIAMPILSTEAHEVDDGDALQTQLSILRAIGPPLDVTVVHQRAHARVGVRARI